MIWITTSRGARAPDLEVRWSGQDIILFKVFSNRMDPPALIFGCVLRIYSCESSIWGDFCPEVVAKIDPRIWDRENIIDHFTTIFTENPYYIGIILKLRV